MIKNKEALNLKLMLLFPCKSQLRMVEIANISASLKQYSTAAWLWPPNKKPSLSAATLTAIMFLTCERRRTHTCEQRVSMPFHSEKMVQVFCYSTLLEAPV